MLAANAGKNPTLAKTICVVLKHLNNDGSKTFDQLTIRSEPDGSVAFDSITSSSLLPFPGIGILDSSTQCVTVLVCLLYLGNKKKEVVRIIRIVAVRDSIVQRDQFHTCINNPSEQVEHY